MSTVKQMQKIGDMVHQLLLTDKRYRDSDRQLCCKVWSLELGIDKDQPVSAYDFLCEYAKSNDRSRLTSAESITRVRRKLQEKYEALRGENYKDKETEVRAVQGFLGYSV